MDLPIRSSDSPKTWRPGYPVIAELGYRPLGQQQHVVWEADGAIRKLLSNAYTEAKVLKYLDVLRSPNDVTLSDYRASTLAFILMHTLSKDTQYQIRVVVELHQINPSYVTIRISPYKYSLPEILRDGWVG